MTIVDFHTETSGCLTVDIGSFKSSDVVSSPLVDSGVCTVICTNDGSLICIPTMHSDVNTESLIPDIDIHTEGLNSNTNVLCSLVCTVRDKDGNEMWWCTDWRVMWIDGIKTLWVE